MDLLYGALPSAICATYGLSDLRIGLKEPKKICVPPTTF